MELQRCKHIWKEVPEFYRQVKYSKE